MGSVMEKVQLVKEESALEMRKLLEDFKLKGKTLSEHQLRLEMDRLAGEARLQIEAQDSEKEE